MIKSYPNERDCEHGLMRGACDTCEYEQDIGELELKLGIAETEIDIFKEESERLKAKVAEIEKENKGLYVALSMPTSEDGQLRKIRDLEQQAKGVEDAIHNSLSRLEYALPLVSTTELYSYSSDLREQAKQLKG